MASSGSISCAAAQQSAMAARDEALLVAQYDMTAVGSSRA